MPDPVATTEPGSGHDHRVAFYDRDAFLVETVATAVVSALDAGSVAAAVVTPEHGAAIERALAAAGLDVAGMLASGDYRAFDAQAALAEVMVDGQVDAEAFDGLLASVFEIAAERDCEVIIYGEVAPLLWRAGDVTGAMRVEDLCNLLPERPASQLTCLYPMRAFDDEADLDPFMDLCERHVEVFPDEHYAKLHDPCEQRRELEYLLEQTVRHADAAQEQFDQAIESRDVIGQAKGILMNSCQVDADTAFEMLREASNRSNRKLRDVASRIVAQPRSLDRGSALRSLNA